jgi:hypothetical protein
MDAETRPYCSHERESQPRQDCLSDNAVEAADAVDDVVSGPCDLDLGFALWAEDLPGWGVAFAVLGVFEVGNPVEEAALVGS